jgi:uncharacterized OB-fold protein
MPRVVHDLGAGIIPLGTRAQNCYAEDVQTRPIHEGLFSSPDDPGGLGLYAGYCLSCKALHFPATDDCPYCGATDCETRLVGRTATLYLATVVTASPPGYQGEVPYGFGLVDLPEGLRVISVIAETDVKKLRPGLPLRLGLRTLPCPEPEQDEGEGLPLASWHYEPAGESP